MVLFTQVIIIPGILFVYLFIFNKRSQGTDSAVSRCCCRTPSAKPTWWAQSWDSSRSPRPPTRGVWLRGGDRLRQCPACTVSPAPSPCTPGQEAVEGPVGHTWKKSLASVPAAVWCQGHHLPLELGEAVKGLKLPRRHCLDPFSELISETETVLPLWVFFFFSMKSGREVVVVVVTLSGAAMWQDSNKRGLILEGGDSEPPGRSAPRCDGCSWIIRVKVVPLSP